MAVRKKKVETEIEKHWEDVEKQKMQEYDEKTRAKLEDEYHRKMDNSKAVSE